MKLHSLAFAAAASCLATGVSAQTVNAAGASASRAVITNVVVSVCGAAASTTVYRNGTNVTRIICPTTVFGGSSTLDFSYDNTTGSYQGIGPVSGVPGALTARINLSTCSGSGTEVIAGKTIAVRVCTGNEATLVRPGIGNADVEPELFANANIPAGASPAVPGGIAQVSGQFGVIFGTIVSEALYRALQADQGLNAAAALSDEANAPTLSRAQIVSMTTANGGPLNTDWTPLFRSATPPALASSPVRVVRRVAGSGSQTSFNAVMLNYLCSPRGVEPATALSSAPGGYTVVEQGSTGNLISQVSSTTAYNLGAVVSRENAVPGTGWGFVKIDGTYPSKANVQAGRYNWMAEQVLTLRAGASANETALFNRLVTLTGSPTTIAGFTAASQNGIVALPFVADAADPQYLAQRTRYRTFGNSCVVPAAVE